jgi:hypothetical protein
METAGYQIKDTTFFPNYFTQRRGDAEKLGIKNEE